MKKDIIWLLIIANTVLMIYWGYDILFKPQYYNYPVFVGNGRDKMVVWKREEEEIKAPIPKFIHYFKERVGALWEESADFEDLGMERPK